MEDNEERPTLRGHQVHFEIYFFMVLSIFSGIFLDFCADISKVCENCLRSKA